MEATEWAIPILIACCLYFVLMLYLIVRSLRVGVPTRRCPLCASKLFYETTDFWGQNPGCRCEECGFELEGRHYGDAEN